MASDKLRALNAQEDKEAEMDMSPMIDMVFLLLIFFIVVSSPMIVKMDPAVKPAVAFNSVSAEDKNGRIVINVRGEDEYYKLNFNDSDAKMTSEDDIADYVEAEVKRIKGLATEYKPKLHLRGDKEALFEFSQTAIAGAARAGVNEIIFSVYPFAATK